MKSDFKQYIKDNYFLLVALIISLITIIYLIGAGVHCNNSCNAYWTEQVQPVVDHCPYYTQSFDNYTKDVNYLYIIEGDGDGNKKQ